MKCSFSVPNRPVITFAKSGNASLRVEWSLEDIFGGIDYWLVTYHRTKDELSNITLNLTINETTFKGLAPNTNYTFQVMSMLQLTHTHTHTHTPSTPQQQQQQQQQNKQTNKNTHKHTHDKLQSWSLGYLPIFGDNLIFDTTPPAISPMNPRVCFFVVVVAVCVFCLFVVFLGRVCCADKSF